MHLSWGYPRPTNGGKWLVGGGYPQHLSKVHLGSIATWWILPSNWLLLQKFWRGNRVMTLMTLAIQIIRIPWLASAWCGRFQNIQPWRLLNHYRALRTDIGEFGEPWNTPKTIMEEVSSLFFSTFLPFWNSYVFCRFHQKSSQVKTTCGASTVHRPQQTWSIKIKQSWSKVAAALWRSRIWSWFNVIHQSWRTIRYC